MSENPTDKLITPQIFADLPVKAGDKPYFQFEAYTNTLASPSIFDAAANVRSRKSEIE